MGEKGIGKTEQDRENQKIRGKGEISSLLYMTFKSYAMRSCVVRNIFPNISNDRGAIMFRIHQHKMRILLNIRTIPEDLNIQQTAVRKSNLALFSITSPYVNSHYIQTALPSPAIQSYTAVCSSTLSVKAFIHYMTAGTRTSG
jgi:hypothetical protein